MNENNRTNLINQFIDFSGNMQYISLYDLATNNNVTLFLVDYPSIKRLKIYAKAEIVDLNAKLAK